jgi:hypothetical protein
MKSTYKLLIGRSIFLLVTWFVSTAAYAVSPLQYTLNSRSSSTAEKVKTLQPVSTHFCYLTSINQPSEVYGYHASAYGYVGWTSAPGGYWTLRADPSSNSSGQPAAIYAATCIPYSQAQSPNQGSRVPVGGAWSTYTYSASTNVGFQTSYVYPTPNSIVKEPVCVLNGLNQYYGRFYGSNQTSDGGWIWLDDLSTPNGRQWRVNNGNYTPAPMVGCFDLGIDRKPNQTLPSLTTFYSLSYPAQLDGKTHVTVMTSASNSFCYFDLIENKDWPTPNESGEFGVGAHILIDHNNKYVLSSCPNNWVDGSSCALSTNGLEGANSHDTKLVRARCVALPILTQ